MFARHIWSTYDDRLNVRLWWMIRRHWIRLSQSSMSRSVYRIPILFALIAFSSIVSTILDILLCFYLNSSACICCHCMIYACLSISINHSLDIVHERARRPRPQIECELIEQTAIHKLQHNIRRPMMKKHNYASQLHHALSQCTYNQHKCGAFKFLRDAWFADLPLTRMMSLIDR